MKNHLFIFFLAVLSHALVSQETPLKEYSYTEFFQMIEEETDTVFFLENALIEYDSLTDRRFKAKTRYLNNNTFEFYETDTILVDKEIKLENVFFRAYYFPSPLQVVHTAIHHISFRKRVQLINCLGRLSNNSFDQFVEIEFDDKVDEHAVNNRIVRRFELMNNSMKNGIKTECDFSSISQIDFSLLNNKIHIYEESADVRNGFLGGNGLTQFWLEGNQFLGEGAFRFVFEEGETLDFQRNNFGNREVELTIATRTEIPRIWLRHNQFSKPVMLDLIYLNPQNAIGFTQFETGIIARGGFFDYAHQNYAQKGDLQKFNAFRRNGQEEYLSNFHRNMNAFKAQSKLLGLLQGHYKQQHDTEFANGAYMMLKDLETKRMAYLFKENPSFDSFFQWKINQFLKVFSNYGTKPSKAIVMSVYVIIFFGFIYLFFPNSWDSHGKNRIIDRYTFFLKYMKRDAGIHEVYMEDKEQEMMSYDRFKQLIHSSEETVPRFFTSTALPLYRWAMAGTRLSASFLQYMDIMKGTWNELPKGQKWWKGMLLIGAFTVAIIYDLIIKMLNALMLSINTFTTLGFGEIPIKGLPRYLAIIQGFIGWFMLTIFSVSLISQLLN